MIHVFVVKKYVAIPMLIIKIIENNTMYNTQEVCLHFVELILTKLDSSIFLVHSSTNLFTNLFLCLHFL